MCECKTITPRNLGVPLEFTMPVKTDWRIGIVGFGHIARQHQASYTNVGWSVAAVADTDPAARQCATDEFGIAETYSDFADLVADPAVDVIDLCTQPTLREPVVRACCDAGKPIITEKPLTESIAEGQRMADAVDAAGIVMAVHQNYRWMRANFLAGQIVKAGLIGQPYFAQIQIFQNQDNFIPADSWYGRSDNFITLQWNNHLADLLRYWLGRDPERIWTRTARSAGQNFTGDMLLTSVYDFGRNLTGTITHHELLQAGQETSHRCRIDGEKGSIDFEFWGPDFRIASSDLGEGMFHIDWAGWEPPPSWAGSMGDLLASVETGRNPSVSARANLSTIRIVQAEYESAQAGGEWITL